MTSSQVNVSETPPMSSQDIESLRDENGLIAGKFKTAADMVNSYKELEGKLGAIDQTKEEPEGNAEEQTEEQETETNDSEFDAEEFYGDGLASVLEEVGIDKNYKILNETENWYSYNLPLELVNVVWEGRYVGQRQKWFLCKFFGNDNEIRLDNHTPEFEDWKWIKPSQAMTSVIPFKKELYANILQSFKQFYD